MHFGINERLKCRCPYCTILLSPLSNIFFPHIKVSQYSLVLHILFLSVLSSEGRTVTLTVSRRPPTAVAQVRVCGICGGQRGKERIVSQRTSGFPLPLSFHRCSILIFLYTLLLPEGHVGEIWAPYKKQCPFQKSGRIA